MELNTTELALNSIGLASPTATPQTAKTTVYASNNVKINNIQLNTSTTKEIDTSLTNAIGNTKKSNIDKIYQSTDKSSIAITVLSDKIDRNNLCDSIIEEDYGRRKTAASSIIQGDEDPVVHVRHTSNPENIEFLKYTLNMKISSNS